MAKKSVSPAAVACKVFESVDALRKLKANKIAALLEAEGIRGEREEAKSCALAQKFSKVSGAPGDSIQVDGEGIHIEVPGAPAITIELPSNLEDFISDFDRDEYPNLVVLDSDRFESLTDELSWIAGLDVRSNFKNKTITLSGSAEVIAKAKKQIKDDNMLISKIKGIDVIYKVIAPKTPKKSSVSKPQSPQSEV